MKTKIKEKLTKIISILVCVMMIWVTCPVNLLSGAVFAQDDVQTQAIPNEVEVEDYGQEISLEGGSTILKAGNLPELEDAINKAQDGDTIKLTKGLIIDRHADDHNEFMFQICDKKITITTDNPSNKISQGYTKDIGLFKIKGKNASLTLENIEIEGDSATNSGTLIEVDEGSLTIGQNVKIAHRHRAPMIYCQGGATVNINGGEISECSDCAIMCVGSTVNINGGKIYSCYGGKMGTVRCYRGIVNINGGEISGCDSECGGAIYCEKGGTVNVNGGKISQCHAKKGGAIYCIDSGVINIDGGTIFGCCADEGGAIYFEDNAGLLNINGGEISSCIATNYGGAIYCGRYGTVNINDGEITRCKSVTGGAIYLLGRTTLVMKGGKISACCVTGSGGAIFVSENCVVRLEKGTITGCYSGNCGNAIAAGYDSTLSLAKVESGLFKIDVRGVGRDTDPSLCGGYYGIYLSIGDESGNKYAKVAEAEIVQPSPEDNASVVSGGDIVSAKKYNLLGIGGQYDWDSDTKHSGSENPVEDSQYDDIDMIDEGEKDDDIDMIDEGADEIENEKYEDEDDEIENDKGPGEKEKNDGLGALAPWLIGAAVVAIGAVAVVFVLKNKGANRA